MDPAAACVVDVATPSAQVDLISRERLSDGNELADVAAAKSAACEFAGPLLRGPECQRPACRGVLEVVG